MDVDRFLENCCIGLFQSNLNAGHSFGWTLCSMFSPSCLLKSQAVAPVSGFTLLAPSRRVSDSSWSTGGQSELISCTGRRGRGGGGNCGFHEKPRHKNLKAQLRRTNVYHLFSWTCQQLNIYSACPLPAIRQADSRQSCARSSRGQHLFAMQGNNLPSRQLPGQETDLGQTYPTENVWCSSL